NEWNARAIPALGERFGAPHRPIFPERDSHRRFVMRQRRAIGTVETPPAPPRIAAGILAADLVAADVGRAAREIDRGLVVESDAAGGVGGVDCGGQRFQELAKSPLACGERLLSVPAAGDVAHHPDAIKGPTGAITHGRGCHRYPDDAAVLANEPLLDGIAISCASRLALE